MQSSRIVKTGAIIVILSTLAHHCNSEKGILHQHHIRKRQLAATAPGGWYAQHRQPSPNNGVDVYRQGPRSTQISNYPLTTHNGNRPRDDPTTSHKSVWRSFESYGPPNQDFRKGHPVSTGLPTLAGKNTDSRDSIADNSKHIHNENRQISGDSTSTNLYFPPNSVTKPESVELAESSRVHVTQLSLAGYRRPVPANTLLPPTVRNASLNIDPTQKVNSAEAVTLEDSQSYTEPVVHISAHGRFIQNNAGVSISNNEERQPIFSRITTFISPNSYLPPNQFSISIQNNLWNNNNVKPTLANNSNMESEVPTGNSHSKTSLASSRTIVESKVGTITESSGMINGPSSQASSERSGPFNSYLPPQTQNETTLGTYLPETLFGSWNQIITVNPTDSVPLNTYLPPLLPLSQSDRPQQNAGSKPSKNIKETNAGSNANIGAGSNLEEEQPTLTNSGNVITFSANGIQNNSGPSINSQPIISSAGGIILIPFSGNVIMNNAGSSNINSLGVGGSQPTFSSTAGVILIPFSGSVIHNNSNSMIINSRDVEGGRPTFSSSGGVSVFPSSEVTTQNYAENYNLVATHSLQMNNGTTTNAYLPPLPSENISIHSYLPPTNQTPTVDSNQSPTGSASVITSEDNGNRDSLQSSEHLTRVVKSIEHSSKTSASFLEENVGPLPSSTNLIQNTAKPSSGIGSGTFLWRREHFISNAPPGSMNQNSAGYNFDNTLGSFASGSGSAFSSSGNSVSNLVDPSTIRFEDIIHIRESIKNASNDVLGFVSSKIQNKNINGSLPFNSYITPSTTELGAHIQNFTEKNNGNTTTTSVQNSIFFQPFTDNSLNVAMFSTGNSIQNNAKNSGTNGHLLGSSHTIHPSTGNNREMVSLSSFGSINQNITVSAIASALLGQESNINLLPINNPIQLNNSESSTVNIHPGSTNTYLPPYLNSGSNSSQLSIQGNGSTVKVPLSESLSITNNSGSEVSDFGGFTESGGVPILSNTYLPPIDSSPVQPSTGMSSVSTPGNVFHITILSQGSGTVSTSTEQNAGLVSITPPSGSALNQQGFNLKPSLSTTGEAVSSNAYLPPTIMNQITITPGSGSTSGNINPTPTTVYHPLAHGDENLFHRYIGTDGTYELGSARPYLHSYTPEIGRQLNSNVESNIEHGLLGTHFDSASSSDPEGPNYGQFRNKESSAMIGPSTHEAHKQPYNGYNRYTEYERVPAEVASNSYLPPSSTHQTNNLSTVVNKEKNANRFTDHLYHVNRAGSNEGKFGGFGRITIHGGGNNSQSFSNKSNFNLLRTSTNSFLPPTARNRADTKPTGILGDGLWTNNSGRTFLGHNHNTYLPPLTPNAPLNITNSLGQSHQNKWKQQGEISRGFGSLNGSGLQLGNGKPQFITQNQAIQPTGRMRLNGSTAANLWK